MSVNIRELVSGYYSPSVIANYSQQYKESETKIEKTLDLFTAVIMHGLYVKGTTVPGLFLKCKKLYRNCILSGLSSSGSVVSAKVSDIMQNIFGERQQTILSEVSKSTEIKDATAQPLLNLAANITFGVVGKYLQENQATEAWLADLMLDQQEWSDKLLPGDLNWETLKIGKDFEDEAKKLPHWNDKPILRLNYQNAE